MTVPQRRHDAAETVTLTVAASPTPHAEILNQCVPILAEQGIELVVNRVQRLRGAQHRRGGRRRGRQLLPAHCPIWRSSTQTRGTHLVSVAGVHIEPMGVYAGRVASLEDLPDGAVIAVPNDATNEGRALLLLEAQGLITLDDSSNLTATPNDIVDNPKNLEFAGAGGRHHPQRACGRGSGRHQLQLRPAAPA